MLEVDLKNRGGERVDQSQANWFHRKQGPCFKVVREALDASKGEFRFMIVGKLIH